MNKAEWDILVDRVAREIYDGKQSGIIDTDMVKLHAQELMKAIQEGFGENIDSTVDEKKYAALYQLQTNVFHFSGAKNWQQLQEMSSLLTDNNSTLPFSDFLKAVKAIDENYNQTYLKAEYVNAVASGQMASKWDQFVSEESALPNLRWVVAAGESVCKLCEGLNDITLPVRHPFWKTNFVPRHFFCDCTIVQEEEGVPITDIANKKIPETSPMFQNNVGISGMAFTDKAPYIKSMPEKVKQQVFVASEELMPNKNKSFLPVVFNDKITPNRLAIWKLDRAKQFDVEAKFGKTGRVLIHKLVERTGTDATDFEDVLKEATIKAKQGIIVEILPKLHEQEMALYNFIFPNLNKDRNTPDFRFNQHEYSEFKKPIGLGKHTLKGNISRASHQADYAIINFNQNRSWSFIKAVCFGRFNEHKLLDKIEIILEGKRKVFTRKKLGL